MTAYFFVLLENTFYQEARGQKGPTSHPEMNDTCFAIVASIIATSVVLMTALTLVVYRTRLGVAMRAASQNAAIAGLMGVNVNQIIAATFMLGAALAAVAGVMVGTYYGIAHYTMGSLLGLKAFCAAVLGGIGNLAGAMLGGMLLGIVEALGAGYIGDFTNNVFGSNYQDVFAFLVLIGVLVFRPSGLLGERIGDPRPVEAGPLGVGDRAVIRRDGARRRDVADLARDRREGGVEVLHRLHHDDPLPPEVDPQLGECVGMEDLGARRVQDDLHVVLRTDTDEVSDAVP